jgi:hypothetical protein
MTQQPSARRVIRPAPKFHGWQRSSLPLHATLRELLAEKAKALPVSDLRDEIEELLERFEG